MTGSNSAIAAATETNASCAGRAASRQLSARSGQSIQQPACCSNSAGIQNPSASGVERQGARHLALQSGCAGSRKRRRWRNRSRSRSPAGIQVALERKYVMPTHTSAPSTQVTGAQGTRNGRGTSGRVRLMTNTPMHTTAKASRMPMEIRSASTSSGNNAGHESRNDAGPCGRHVRRLESRVAAAHGWRQQPVVGHCKQDARLPQQGAQDDGGHSDDRADLDEIRPARPVADAHRELPRRAHRHSSFVNGTMPVMTVDMPDIQHCRNHRAPR